MGSDSKNDNKHNSNVAGEPLQIPVAAKKIVQSLKEILNKSCTDTEIYDVLLDCNMDPDDAVQLLLSQDTFKEVKSKRERRKEVKETLESRVQSDSGTANRRFRFGSEQAVGQTGSTENNYNELCQSAYKRELGSAGSSSSSYMFRAAGNIINEQPPIHSNFFNADNRRQLIGTGDSVTSSVQLSLGHRPTWEVFSKGQVSMADIVRGRAPNEGSQMFTEISCISHPAVLPNSSHYHKKSLHVLSSPESELHEDPYSSHPSNVSEMIPGSAGQHDVDNKGLVIEHLPVVTGSFVIDSSAASSNEEYANRTILYSDGAKFSRNSQSHNVLISEKHYDIQNQSSNNNGSASAPSRQIFEDGAGGASNDDLLKVPSSNDSHGHMFQEGRGKDLDLSFPSYSASSKDDVMSAVSSSVTNLQQLNIGKEDLVMPPTENLSAVVFPYHLLPFATDCSHLSFGTYKSGVASLSPTASNPIESNLEVSAADGSSAVHSNFRKLENSDDGKFGTHDTQRATADARNYDPPVSLQPELVKQDIPEATRENHYTSSLPFPDTSIDDIQQSGPNFPFMVDPIARNLPLSRETHLQNMPSGLFAPPRQSLRRRDSSSFLSTKSMPSGYGSAVSSHPTIPKAEVFSSVPFSLPQLSPHALPVSNLAKGAVLPQRRPVHSYSQSRLPSSELGNMIGYPSVPPRKTVLSSLQQTYPQTSVFHDSMAGMKYDLLQYRNSSTTGSFPLSNNGPSTRGNFVGNSSNIPGSFSHNQSALPMGTPVGYNGLLHSQYMDGNSFPHDQHNHSSTWDFGAGQLTSSMLSDSGYYSLLGQNQHHQGYQSNQQASQHYESRGYPNTYHSDRITRTSAPRPSPTPW